MTLLGSANFAIDETGKLWQKCVGDAVFPDGQKHRITVFADKDNAYIPAPELQLLFDYEWNSQTQTMHLYYKYVIRVLSEIPLDGV